MLTWCQQFKYYAKRSDRMTMKFDVYCLSMKPFGQSIVFEVDYSIAMPAVTSFVIFLIKFVVDTISNQKEQTVTIFNNIIFFIINCYNLFIIH